MKRDGRIAFVLPYAAMSRDPYAKFRKGDFQRGALPVSVRFTEGWSFPSDVQPLFPVPSCVLFAQGERLPRRLPTTVTRYSGHLPMRDASPEVAAKCLRGVKEPWPADTGISASPYREKFRQGATLVPRRLVIVERVPVKGRLGANPLAPMVRGRTSSQDKAPWKFIDPLEGPVEAEFLRPVYLGESIAPYRMLGNVTGVIPWNAIKHEVMDKNAAYGIGKRLLGEWLAEAEKLWDTHGSKSMTFKQQCDYFGKLSSQYPLPAVRVAYSKSGSQPAAVVICDEKAIIDHKLYYLKTKTATEARYLCAILNSETARAAAEHWQSEGQWGKRDFDKAIFNLPIPLYDSKNALHRDLAAAAELAEALAAKVELKEAEHFTRTRARIRTALIDQGIATKIERMVAQLICVAPAATLRGGGKGGTDAD